MNLPETVSWKFGYADDWAIVTQSSNFEALETTVSADTTLLASYFKRWYLNMNEYKIVSCVFHLHNRQAERRLHITASVVFVPSDPSPKYLRITLDRSLTYRQHLKGSSQKLKSRVSLTRNLTGTNCGASPSILRVLPPPPSLSHFSSFSSLVIRILRCKNLSLGRGVPPYLSPQGWALFETTRDFHHLKAVQFTCERYGGLGETVSVRTRRAVAPVLRVRPQLADRGTARGPGRLGGLHPPVGQEDRRRGASKNSPSLLPCRAQMRKARSRVLRNQRHAAAL